MILVVSVSLAIDIVANQSVHLELMKASALVKHLLRQLGSYRPKVIMYCLMRSYTHDLGRPLSDVLPHSRMGRRHCLVLLLNPDAFGLYALLSFVLRSIT